MSLRTTRKDPLLVSIGVLLFLAGGLQGLYGVWLWWQFEDELVYLLAVGSWACLAESLNIFTLCDRERLY